MIFVYVCMYKRVDLKHYTLNMIIMYTLLTRSVFNLLEGLNEYLKFRLGRLGSRTQELITFYKDYKF